MQYSSSARKLSSSVKTYRGCHSLFLSFSIENSKCFIFFHFFLCFFANSHFLETFRCIDATARPRKKSLITIWFIFYFSLSAYVHVAPRRRFPDSFLTRKSFLITVFLQQTIGGLRDRFVLGKRSAQGVPEPSKLTEKRTFVLSIYTIKVHRNPLNPQSRVNP